MKFLKIYRSRVANSAKTLTKRVAVASLLDQNPSSDLRAQLASLGEGSINFWDFGVRAAAHIAEGDEVVIVCKDEVHSANIIKKIDSEDGELSVLLDWDPVFQKPWRNPYAMLVNATTNFTPEVQEMLTQGEHLRDNLYRIPH